MHPPLLVIGEPGKLRSQILETVAGEYGAEFIAPVFLSSDEAEESADFWLSDMLMGRRISAEEVGCALAHEKARAVAALILSSTPHENWALIAEDDAELSTQKLIDIHEDLREVGEIESPSVISFYCLGQSSTRSRIQAKPEFPPGAVCYAINKRGTELLRQRRLEKQVFVADWPPIFHDFLFFQGRVRIQETGGRSTIGDRPAVSIARRVNIHLRQFIHAKEISLKLSVPHLSFIKWILITILWRDLKGRITWALSKLH